MTLRVASPPAVFSSCPRSSSPRQLLLHCSATTLLSAGAHVSSAPLHALCLSHAWSSVRCALCEPARNARCNGRSTTTSHHRQSLVFCCTGVVQCCSSINTPLCATETNLFETNRQNVTVQMQNHDGNRLARSNFATATRISFWKDVLALLSQRILGVSEIGPFSKNSGVWFGLVGGYGQFITFRQHALLYYSPSFIFVFALSVSRFSFCSKTEMITPPLSQ